MTSNLIHLQAKTKAADIELDTEKTLLDLALANNLDWGFACTRGTCARCRCLIEEGSEHLNEPTDAELDRLGSEEIQEGYRLACQAEPVREGTIKAVNKTYF
ncbi:2Fe-2S iron-sulfur cluster-binding protein [Marinicrinis sediminis]|uniref:2Fe-2S iron-sulfur cluster-binding protein n=1 Tax=Marinicrinis sediminis TaxID=1652465 RepID=A0ABW5RD45_9BACL